MSTLAHNCIDLFTVNKNETNFKITNAKISVDSSDFGLKLVEEAEINRRFSDLTNVIGFSRNQNGQIEPLISNNNEFESVRHLPSGPFGDGWNRKRVAKIIPLQIDTSVTDSEIKINKHFEELPDKFKNIFKNGFILKTVPDHGGFSEWSLLMMTAPSGDGVGGRSGILLHNGKPVIFTDRLKNEFLLELKGAGSAEVQGGFFKHKDYTFKGGAVARQVVREHENINHFFSSFGSHGVLSLGYSTFRTHLGHQGILFRLTPGTTRMTFQKSNSFSQLNTNESIENFGQIWGTYLKNGFIALSHAENVVVNKYGNQFFPTDLSDLLPASRFPVQWGHRNVSLNEALTRSLTAVTEIEGFNIEKIVNLKNGLKKAFILNEGQQAKFDNLNTIKEIAEFILKEIIYPKLASQISKNWNDSIIDELNQLKKSLPKSEFLLDLIYTNLQKKLIQLKQDDPNNFMIELLSALTKDKESLLSYLNEIKETAHVSTNSRINLRLYTYMNITELISIKTILVERLNELSLILSSITELNNEQESKLVRANDLIHQINQMNDIEFLDFLEKNNFQNILN